MLRFLVTSTTRRRLLQMLWGQDVVGSVSDLAGQCGVSFASAHRELNAMRAAGLAKTRHEPGRTVFSADSDYPHAELVRQLASLAAPSKPPTKNREGQAVRRMLKTLGAPINGRRAKHSDVDTETALVDGIKLARRDATVARIIPLCLWHERDSIDWKKLVATVHGAEDKHALGFFLELTSKLTGDQRFKSCASMLRDKRVRAVRDFFDGRSTSSARELADLRTPKLARHWGFRMNMSMESFESIFAKFSSI